MPLECALPTRHPSAEDGGQACGSSSRFCIYVRFRLQLPSAGVQALFRVKCAPFDYKVEHEGVCNRLLVDLCQWQRPRGVQRDPEKGGAQAQRLAQGLWFAQYFWLPCDRHRHRGIILYVT